MMTAEEWEARQEAEVDYWYRVELAKIKARGTVFPDAPGGNSSRIFPDGCYSRCPHDDVAEDAAYPPGVPSLTRLGMETFTLPESPELALKQLNALGSLVTATDWQRSAIVRAMVTKAAGGRPTENMLKTEQVSVAALAKAKIHGLSSRNTVQRYYDAWVLTGLPEPQLGEPTEIPDIPFPKVIRKPKPPEPPRPTESSTGQIGASDAANDGPSAEPAPTASFKPGNVVDTLKALAECPDRVLKAAMIAAYGSDREALRRLARAAYETYETIGE